MAKCTDIEGFGIHDMIKRIIKKMKKKLLQRED